MSLNPWLRRLALPIAAAASAFTSGAVVASEPDVARVQDWDDTTVGSGADRHARLAASVRARADALGIAPALASGMVVTAAGTTAKGGAGLELVEVRGSFAGVPLLGPIGRVLVDRAGGGRVRTWVGHGPIGALTNPIARLSAADARLKVAESGLPGASGRGPTRLVALPGPTHTRLVWLIEAPLDRRALVQPVFAVDAETGRVRVLHDRVRTTDVRSFARNPVLDPVAQIYDLVDDSTSPSLLGGTHFVAQNCTGNAGDGTCQNVSTAVANAGGDFLYDAPDVTNPADNTQMTDTFAEVSIYYHADKFFDWLGTHGFDGLDCHDGGGQAVLVANYHWVDDEGEWPYDNAFYSGDCDATMVFGQGTDVDFAYDGDVVYHELGHGVVDRLMGDQELGWDRRRSDALLVDAGAMNEGFADFFSSTYAGDPVVGDYIGEYWSTLSDDGLRNNDNDFVCPDHLIGEVHLDSEPFAAMLWATQEEYGDAVVSAAFDTIELLNGNATLEEGSAVFRDVVDAQLGGAAGDFVDEAVTSRGLVDCLRATSPDTLRARLYLREGGYYTPFVPPPMQLRLDVPEGAGSVTLGYSLEAYYGIEAVAGVLVRRDAAVEFDYEQTPDEMQVSSVHDEEHLDLGEGSIDIEVGGAQTLYVAIVNQTNTVVRAGDFTVEWHGGGGETDGGTADTGVDGTAGDVTGDEGPSDDEADTGSSDGSTGAASVDEGDDGDEADDDGDEAHDGDGDGSSGDEGSQSGEGGGCGCSTEGAPDGWDLLALASIALLRRRRPRR